MATTISFTVPAIPVAQPRQRGSAKKASDAALLAAYNKNKSVWLVARQFGMCGQSVHERLTKLGVVRKPNFWTADDDAILQERYTDYRRAGKLGDLAVQLGRTKHFICRKARGLGLTDKKAPKVFLRKWRGMSCEHATVLFDAFKESRLGLGQYCQKMGFDDLGFSRAMKEHFADEWDCVIESKQPRQTMYRLGRQVEYAVRDDLKKRGYPIALRSPRSGGPADIVALKTGKQLLVQAKRSMACPVADWNALFDLAESVGATPVLAGRPTGSGLVYKRLTGRKDGSKRRQPMEDFEP